MTETGSNTARFSQTRVTNSTAETSQLGKTLGQQLAAGDVVALYGELGSGKTTFTKGLSVGLGAMKEEGIRSPTFVLLNLYKGRLPIYHIDLYRVRTLERLHDIGYEDYAFADGVVIIEWAEKAEEVLPPNAVRVRFKTLAENSREIRIESAPGNRKIQL